MSEREAKGHTPGFPAGMRWSADLDFDLTLRAEDGSPVCQVADHNLTEVYANLIAAAPDLLTACIAAETWLKGWASAEPYLSDLRAAITKATGGTP